MSKYLDQYSKQTMWEAHNKKCFYCREALLFKNIQVDHVIPQTTFENEEKSLREKYNLDNNFGFNTLDNFVPACQSCNTTRKGSKELQNGIPMWLNEISPLKEKIITNAIKLKNKLAFDLPDKYKEFFLTSPDFSLSDLSLEKIRKTDIPLYKGLAFHPDYYPLYLASPENSDISVPITNLSQYETYRNLGYYGLTTLDISLQSECEACLVLFEKFEGAIIVDKKFNLKDYYRSLPATTLHVIGPEEDFEYGNYSTIGEYVDAKDNVTAEISDTRIIITIRYPEFNEQEYYIFKEILQADFTGNGNNESIMFVHYKSTGTLNFSFTIQAAYLNGELVPQNTL